MQQMNCFPCICCPQTCYNDKKENSHAFNSSPQCRRLSGSPEGNVNVEKGNIKGQNFNFWELAVATQNFKQEFLLGEGRFGRVYKGQIQGTDQIVAVKQLDRNGLQGNKEFLVEVLMLSSLHHQNLVNLIGYCADGEQRLLVYEFVPLGSLEDHVLELEPDKKPLDWYTRMSIALGAARGLEYLHVKANPPVIFRDFKSSNILLDNDYEPKLSDFGLAKLGLLGDKRHASSRVIGTYGYCAPEYARTGHLTMQSDVYSFGVVLLELITGRRVIDNTRPIREQNLVSWAQPIFRDPRRFCEMADPLLDSKFPERGLNQAVAIAAMCLQDEATARPMMSDVVTALSFLSVASESDPTPTDTRKGGDKSRSSSHSESSRSSGFRSGSKSDKFYEDEDIINSSEATTSDAAWSGGPRSARISRQRDGSASLDYRTGGSANWVLEFTSSDEDPEPDRR